MGVEKKFDIDNQYELVNIRQYLENLPEDMNISISLTAQGDKKPRVMLEGSITRQELGKMLENRRDALHSKGQRDTLTGMYNKEYFDKRMATVDRSQVLLVAVINININDWKFVNDNFGDEESDRLIKIVADVIKGHSKPYFICGRIDGDVFGVIIPMALDGEAEEFVKDVFETCLYYEDSVLAPSVATGIQYKTNIEQSLDDLMSEAEYVMFENKFEVKSAPDYRKRLEHGLNN